MGFETQLLQFMAAPGYRPMKQHELAYALRVDARGGRSELRHTLYAMEQAGKIVRLRKNRWSLPDTENREIGTLKMLAKGGAIFVPDQPGGTDAYISKRNTGVALPNDKVAVELFHSEYANRRRGGRETTVDRAEARVVEVIERATNQIVGLLRHTPYYSYVIPDLPGFQHDVRIDDPLGLAENHKVVVELGTWIDPYKPLKGTITKDLGRASDPGVDIDSLLHAAGIQEEFPPEVVAEAEQISGTVSEERLNGRRDLREAMIFTVDPETARDYDDAVSLEPASDGGWILGVHIADVSTYVQPGSLIDQEALRRGNSIYLVDRAVMMLPEELTTRICSLNPNNDHLTHTVELHLNPEGSVQRYETFASVIHSQARLTYTQVQALIDGEPDHQIPEPAKQRLENLWPLVQKIRAKRVENGSVEINTPEIEIKLNDQGRVEKMMPRTESKEAYQLIEECMLLANRAVAEILIANATPALFRIHDEPDAEQWAAMGMELQALGIDKLPQSRQEINEAIQLATGTAVEYTANLAILRNFKRAEYATEQIGHFGLAFDDYTHFTSPIRRYPDLLVHRMLKAIEQNQAAPLKADAIAEMAVHCNQTEQTADELSKKSTETKRMEYYSELLNHSTPQTFNGYIVAIKGKGMIVELPDSLQRGMLPFASITSDWLEANDAMTHVKTSRGKIRYTIGDRIEVALAKVDLTRGFVDFVLADQVAIPRHRARKRKIQPDLKTGQPRYRGRRRRRN